MSSVSWDGDGQPRSPLYQDIYRSRGPDGDHGLAQARHVFLQGCELLGPQAVWKHQPHWSVLENGFGLGLNFLATWQAWRLDPHRPTRLHYLATEAAGGALLDNKQQGLVVRGVGLIQTIADIENVVIAERGGYGSLQLLPYLDPRVVRDGCKPLIGYSDVTTLLQFQTLTCGVVSFHGPMLDRRLGLGPEGYDRDSLVRAVSQPVPLGELAPEGVVTVRPGEASGPLFGGTLTQLLTSLGTPWAFDPPPGYVLLLDEVGERPYRLDRMVTQARQAGLLARAVAVIVGELPNCDEPSGDPAGRAVMAELLADFPGPVIMGFPTGHTAGPTYTLPLGVRCRVIAGSRSPGPRVVVEESAVS